MELHIENKPGAKPRMWVTSATGYRIDLTDGRLAKIEEAEREVASSAIKAALANIPFLEAQAQTLGKIEVMAGETGRLVIKHFLGSDSWEVCLHTGTEERCVSSEHDLGAATAGLWQARHADLMKGRNQ